MGYLTNRKVKLTGYILAKSCFWGVFMDRNKIEVDEHAKKARGQYPVTFGPKRLGQ